MVYTVKSKSGVYRAMRLPNILEMRLPNIMSTRKVRFTTGDSRLAIHDWRFTTGDSRHDFRELIGAQKNRLEWCGTL